MKPRPPLPTPQRFSELSPQRQALLRLCQETNYGSVRGLEIRGGEPSFERAPVVEIDLKLDGEDPPRPESSLGDFALSREVTRLLERLDDRNVSAIDHLEIRAGLPRRVVLRFSAASVRSNSRPGADEL